MPGAENIFYTADRQEWRQWLSACHDRQAEVWLVFPLKNSGEKRLTYNDAVEEALCFGWIDSRVCKLDDSHTIQRFSPRREGRPYSQSNIERLAWLDRQGLLLPEVARSVREIIAKPFSFPEDIMAAIRADPAAWANFCQFPPSYRRIRTAYVEGARNRPEEFKKRLNSLMQSARANKMLGYGGIEKYY
jgi:uncharacterized protein YdeI (YjbR/CyaY-like superfamily)